MTAECIFPRDQIQDALPTKLPWPQQDLSNLKKVSFSFFS